MVLIMSLSSMEEVSTLAPNLEITELLRFSLITNSSSTEIQETQKTQEIQETQDMELTLVTLANRSKLICRDKPSSQKHQLEELPCMR
jgi:hypothetical protein